MQHEACGASSCDAPVVTYQVFVVRAAVAGASRRVADFGLGVERGNQLVAVIVAVQHVWRKQCFHRSDPPPFFCCLRKWLAPHVHQRD